MKIYNFYVRSFRKCRCQPCCSPNRKSRCKSTTTLTTFCSAAGGLTIRRSQKPRRPPRHSPLAQPQPPFRPQVVSRRQNSCWASQPLVQEPAKKSAVPPLPWDVSPLPSPLKKVLCPLYPGTLCSSLASPAKKGRRIPSHLLPLLQKRYCTSFTI